MMTPVSSRFPKRLPFLFSGRIGLALLYLTVVSYSCNTLKLPPKKIGFFVRDIRSGFPLSDVPIHLLRSNGDSITQDIRTNEFGYFELKKKQLRNGGIAYDLHNYRLVSRRAVPNGNALTTVSDTLVLNNYHHYYDCYLDGSPFSLKEPQPLPDALLVADMHYHVSMRVQNLFGTRIYGDLGEKEGVPENINWYKDLKKLKVLHNGRWKKPYIGPLDPKKVARGGKWKRRSDKFATLTNTPFVRPPKGSSSNYLTHFTQATHPHMKQGRVGLAFNAISPFEHSVSNTPGKRRVSNALVTGAPLQWLRRIGWRKDTLTHWANFNLEYATLAGQKRDFNDFYWRFFTAGTNLKDNIPTVVSVVEGSHILQDQFFPHVFDYNLEDRTERQDKDLFNYAIRAGALLEGSESKMLFDSIFQPMVHDKVAKLGGSDSMSTASKVVIQSLLDNRGTQMLSRREWNDLGAEEQDSIGMYVDDLLFKELDQNIDSLKQLNDPPVMMVTVAHLTYNGMVGHSPNLDGGKFPTNVVAQKNFNIRVSDDPTYRRQWSGVFFTIPGVNKFGKRVIDRLVSRQNGHRIFIDLKHCDYSARKYFFEEVMIDTVRSVILKKGTKVITDTLINRNADQRVVKEYDDQYMLDYNLVSYDTVRIPPICSHCCVTGLPNDYSSPLNDDYALLRSPSTTTFNPFSINLFDEEIRTICTNDGIIGIPLEQRVLGGYINKKVVRDYKIKRNGEEVRNRVYRNRRWTNVRRLFRHYRLHDSLLIKTALDYTRDTMQVPLRKGDALLKRERCILKRTQDDYISVAPFLANLFHIIDHSDLPTEQAWDHICIGSDLDGLIDPIDLCPTAGHYPYFHTRLKQFIPVFLAIRAKNDPSGRVRGMDDYFNENFTIDQALNKLFYLSLRDFTDKYFGEALSESIARN